MSFWHKWHCNGMKIALLCGHSRALPQGGCSGGTPSVQTLDGLRAGRLVEDWFVDREGEVRGRNCVERGKKRGQIESRKG